MAPPRASGRTGPGGRTPGNRAPDRRRDHRGRGMVWAVHRCLLARRESRPRASAGAGPAGGCHRAEGRGKRDASRAPRTALGRPAGDRGGRAGLRGSVDGAGPRRGDCERALLGCTADCSRRAHDHTNGRGRTAPGRAGRPASGGSPRPRGPGDVRWAVDNGAAMCENFTKPPTPPRGGCARGPGGPALGPHPSTSGVAAAYPKTEAPSTL